MANELRIGTQVVFNLDPASLTRSFTEQVDVAAAKYVASVQTVGTTEETLDKGDITTIGRVIVRNTDDTNNLSVGSVTATYSILLEPGEIASFRPNGTNIYVKAAVAAIEVEYIIIAD